jgi:CRP/FNR family transcriptional regulator
VADREVDDALARSFLGKLPREVVLRVRSEGERADYPAGTTVYRAGSGPRAALVVQGLIRVYMTSLEGRQVTVRYARAADVLGIAVLVAGRSMSASRPWRRRAFPDQLPDADRCGAA